MKFVCPEEGQEDVPRIGIGSLDTLIMLVVGKDYPTFLPHSFETLRNGCSGFMFCFEVRGVYIVDGIGLDPPLPRIKFDTHSGTLLRNE